MPQVCGDNGVVVKRSIIPPCGISSSRGLVMQGWIMAILAAASVYLLWRQNRILARKASPTLEQPYMRRYWPLILMTAMMLLTWTAIGYDLYNRHRNPLVGSNFSAIYAGKEPSKHVWKNEKVLLDGFHYQNCVFYNVTFEYNGTTPIQMNDSKIHGFTLASKNEAITDWMIFLKGMGALQPNVNLDLQPGMNVDVPHETIR